MMMKCGHAASGISNGKPCCSCCFGIDPNGTIIDDNPPSLEGRQARCAYCKRIVDSSPELAYFGYKPHLEYDDYYCGCRGWD